MNIFWKKWLVVYLLSLKGVFFLYNHDFSWIMTDSLHSTPLHSTPLHSTILDFLDCVAPRGHWSRCTSLEAFLEILEHQSTTTTQDDPKITPQSCFLDTKMNQTDDFCSCILMEFCHIFSWFLLKSSHEFCLWDVMVSAHDVLRFLRVN